MESKPLQNTVSDVKMHKDADGNPFKEIQATNPNAADAYLNYFAFPGETATSRSYFTQDIEALKRKWVLSRTGDEKGSELGSWKSNKVIIVTRDLPYKLSVIPEWISIAKQRIGDLEGSEAINVPSSTKHAVGDHSVGLPLLREGNKSHDETAAESLKKKLEANALNAAEKEPLDASEEAVYLEKHLKGASGMRDVSKLVGNRNEVGKAGEVTEGAVPSTNEVMEKKSVFTIVEDDLVFNVANFIPGEFQTITIGSPVINFEPYTYDGKLVAFLEENLAEALKEKHSVPVFLEEAARKETYCDQLLSPLFHYRTPPLGTGFPELDWPGYVKLNEGFFNVLKNHYKEGDIVLVFDYHLMLLPKMLREMDSVAKIGFYLKSLFPSSEMCRILPQREQLLRGVLSANMVGFQTFQYTRHFLTACTRILGVECSIRGIEPCFETGGTGSRVASIPCGIDTDRWLREVGHPEFLKRLEDLKSKFGQRKIIIGIDSLDYVRGIPHKIMAFHEFLANDPSWAAKLLFLQIAVVKGFDKSSPQASIFAQLGADQHDILSKVYQVCGAMNAEFGSFDALPVHFLLADLSLEELAPLYACADVAIITSLRESFSYTAYEFTLCQRKSNKGVLILSEFSGSAQSLGAAALCINPWDTHSFSTAIHDALIMSDQEKAVRHEYAYNYILKHDAKMWGRNLMSDLQNAVHDLEHERLNIPIRLEASKVIQTYLNGKHRFLIFGLHGCLFPQRHMPIEAELFCFENLPNYVQKALCTFNKDPHTTVFIVSSACTETVERATGNLSNFYLFAENGHFVRWPSSIRFEPELADIDTSWLEGVVDTFQYFVQRTPGSFVHRTQTAVSWHYENTHRDHGAMQARDLLMHLWAGPMRAKSQADIAVGSGSVEVRASNLSKASSIEKYVKEVLNNLKLSATECAFVCIGNFLPRDEDIFQVLQKVASGGTVGVRSGSSNVTTAPAGVTTGANTSAAVCPFVKAEAVKQSYKESSVVAAKVPPQPSHPNLWGDFDASLQFSAYEPQSLISGRRKLLGGPKEKAETLATKAAENFTNYCGGLENRSIVGSSRQHIPNLITCTVGRKQSRAEYHLLHQSDVGLLLSEFAKYFNPSEYEDTFDVDAAGSASPLPQAVVNGTLSCEESHISGHTALAPSKSYPMHSDAFTKLFSDKTTGAYL